MLNIEISSDCIAAWSSTSGEGRRSVELSKTSLRNRGINSDLMKTVVRVMPYEGSGKEDEDVASGSLASNRLRSIKDSYLIDKLLLPIVTVRREAMVMVEDIFFLAWGGPYIYIRSSPRLLIYLSTNQQTNSDP